MSFKKIGDVYLADTARVLGEVELHAGVSIWYGASIRGDVARIVIGENTNVQDNATVHCDHGVPNIIGRNCTIGHNAVVHGEWVGDDCLIGMGAILLGRSRVGNGCVIAAGAVVRPGMVVPDNSVVMGVPGKVVREATPEDRAFQQKNAPHYLELARLHASDPKNPRIVPWPGPQTKG